MMHRSERYFPASKISGLSIFAVRALMKVLKDDHRKTSLTFKIDIGNKFLREFEQNMNDYLDQLEKETR